MDDRCGSSTSNARSGEAKSERVPDSARWKSAGQHFSTPVGGIRECRDQDDRETSGGDRQGGCATFRFKRDFHHLACFAFTTAATGGATRVRLHVLERARAARDGMADILIGNGLAEADVHGGVFTEHHSTGAIEIRMRMIVK
jgi:hypothetical protein